MEKFKKISEFDYTPPIGGWDCLSNIEIILSNILEFFPNINIELTKKEFLNFFKMYKDEIFTSLLLDKRNLGYNKFLMKGFDFRGIKIRIK